MDLALYGQPENRIAARDLGRLFVCAARITGRADIGLLNARGFQPSGLGLIGLLATEGPNLDTALRNLVRLLQYNTLAGYSTLSVGEKVVTAGFDLRIRDFVGANFILEGAIGILFRLVKWLCGDSWEPEEVHLSRRTPPNPRPFHDFFGMPVRFSATEDALLFSAEWLTHPVARDRDRQGPRQFELAAASFSEAVRRQAAISLGFTAINAQVVANALGVSRRQLFRRLEAEGTSCQQIVDDLKFDRACHLLGAGDAPLADIAFALGFPDQSSFTRAFGRWSGMPPSEWRKRHR